MDNTDRTKLKSARAAIRREQEERDAVISVLLNDAKGRNYLWWVLTITKINSNPFSANALTTSFACGEQNVGQQILAHIMDVNPAGYVQMLKERLNNGPGNTSPDTDDDPRD